MRITCPDGAFELPDNLTFREMQQIKRVTGLNPGQIPDALDEGDPMVVVAFVMVAAARAGRTLDENKVLNWTLDDIDFGDEDQVEDTADEEDEADPTEA